MDKNKDVESGCAGEGEPEKKNAEPDYFLDQDDTANQRTVSLDVLPFLIILVLGFLYIFICSLDLVGNAFKLLGGKEAGEIIGDNEIVTNPISGLVIGVLVTVLLQSSSTSSSLVVAMVANDFISVKTAVPIIMGANIGTSVTNTIVALGQIQDQRLFARSFAGATVHDMFNILTVVILLPIEWATGFLRTITRELIDEMNLNEGSDTELELLSVITDPLTDKIVLLDKAYLKNLSQGQEVGSDEQLLKIYCGDKKCDALFSKFGMEDKASGAVLLTVSLILMFLALFVIVKSLQTIFKGQIARVIKKFVNADFPGCFGYLTGYLAIIIGTGITILVQSSSIFTSTLTPLIGIGVVTLERAFPLTLGANIGTTVTSVLAALASTSNFREALQISFCHFLFNVLGILIWYPIPKIRQIPIMAAKRLGKTTARYRWFAFFYIFMVFFIFPAIIFGFSVAGDVYVILFTCIVVLMALIIGVLKVLQHYKPDMLPELLRDFKFLPIWLRSLEPYDNLLRKLFGCFKTGFGMCSEAQTVSEYDMGKRARYYEKDPAQTEGQVYFSKSNF